MASVTRVLLRARRRVTAAAVAVATAATALTACGYGGASTLPLPGGPDLGDDPYEIKVQFANVLDLVPHSLVKVNDVTVGRVTAVDLEGWHAIVTARIRRDVRLPDNAVAMISQTSLLGEKFVALSKPPGATASTEPLGDDDVIPLSRTSRTTEVEEVLSALSLLVNGGGLEQIQTITREANAAMHGRTDRIKSVLRQVNTFVGTMDRQRNQIIRTIERLDRLIEKLRENKKVITDTIDTAGPAVRLLARQRADLTKLLVSLDKLGQTATRVIDRSRDDLVKNLESLQPILHNVAKAGKVLPEGIEMMLSFPFPPTTEQAFRGDYANLFITLDLNLDNLTHNLFAGTPLEELAKTGARLRTKLSPPRTAFPETPLGALPEPSYGGEQPGGLGIPGLAEPGAGLPPGLGGPDGSGAGGGRDGGGKDGKGDEKGGGSSGSGPSPGPTPWPGGGLFSPSGRADESGLQHLLVGGLG
jgi:phospholipid/cholesterol/gamma-HCH transport system substrate-binding protein